jgi:hypothetical protein
MDCWQEKSILHLGNDVINTGVKKHVCSGNNKFPTPKHLVADFIFIISFLNSSVHATANVCVIFKKKKVPG